MKVVKVMIAATEELRQEMLEFTSLIEHLNKVLRPRGIELKRVKWNSEEEAVFQEKLKDCEFCLKLYWTELSSNSEKELRLAYDRLKQGDNPKNLYVFFKEPANDISDALKDFKANFVTNYGHFFCKFENVDTMNLHFILQFEIIQNQTESGLIKIKGGKVLIGDETFVNLDNVPFAALNKEYQRLKEELTVLDEQQVQLKKRFSENVTDSDVLNELVTVSTKRNSVAEEFEKHQRYLFNIALSFAKKSEEMYSERLAKARELFEKGEVSEADRILNMEEMKRETEKEKILYKQNHNNLKIKSEEFLTKAQTVMANEEILITDRFNTACDAYKEAASIADTLNDHYLSGTTHYLWGILLSQFNDKVNAAKSLELSILAFRILYNQSPEKFYHYLARSLNTLAEIHFEHKNYREVIELCKESKSVLENTDFENSLYLGDVFRLIGKIKSLNDLFRDAENIFNQALQIYYDLEAFQEGTCQENIARSLYEIGKLKMRGSRYEDALNKFQESVKIFNTLVSKESRFIVDVVIVVLEMACCYDRIRDKEKAISEYSHAANMSKKLANENPTIGLPLMAKVYDERASMMKGSGNYKDSEDLLRKSYMIYVSLSHTNPEEFLPNLGENLSMVAEVLHCQEKYDEENIELKKCLYVYLKLSNSDNNKYSPFIKDIKRRMATMYNSLGMYEDSLKLLTEIINENKNLHPMERVSILFDMAGVQFSDKERKETLEEIIKICTNAEYPYLITYQKIAKNRLASLQTKND